ncbi:hypothetical protein SAY86_018919 [Trapa natans]|uniref:EF-hand domain-containing protein n=1 Tax=Trapa natans TaxID=22666 RepID=A0AAN7LP55_TRANT|nr:hypothetical protein SAY86_018919 [Trapa natans]
MKFIEITKLSPKRLFGSKKAVSRSHPPSLSFFSSSTSSSYEESSLHEHNGSSDRVPGSGTPVSVLPGEWSDTDRGGFRSVSRTELEALLSRDEAALIMSEAGCGGDSCISLDDLIGRIGSVSGPVCDSELRETFEFFDTDHDGRITAEELLGVFTTVLGDEQCTLEDCRRMVKAVGRNGAGMVFLEDFIRMMEIDI